MSNEIISLEKKQVLIISEAKEWLAKEIENKKLKVYDGYNLANEVTTAMYAMSQAEAKDPNTGKRVPALSVCSKDSVMACLQRMVSMGLSVAKDQMYPIVRGTKMTLLTSYFGDLAVFERLYPHLEASANVVHEGDEFDYCTDPRAFNYLDNVRNKFENRQKKIIASYGYIRDRETGKMLYGEVMDEHDIKKAWDHSSDPNRKSQKDFPQEMAKRTLYKRLIKVYIKKSSSLDSGLVRAYLDSQEFVENPEEETAKVPHKDVVTAKKKGATAKDLDEIISAKESSEDVEAKPVANEVTKVDSEYSQPATFKVTEDGEVIEEQDLLSPLGPDSEIPF